MPFSVTSGAPPPPHPSCTNTGNRKRPSKTHLHEESLSTLSVTGSRADPSRNGGRPQMGPSSPYPAPGSCKDARFQTPSGTVLRQHLRAGGRVVVYRPPRPGAGLGRTRAVCVGGRQVLRPGQSPRLPPRAWEWQSPHGNPPLCLSSPARAHPRPTHHGPLLSLPSGRPALSAPRSLPLAGSVPGWPTGAGGATATPDAPPTSSVPCSGRNIPLSQNSS